MKQVCVRFRTGSAPDDVEEVFFQHEDDEPEEVVKLRRQVFIDLVAGLRADRPGYIASYYADIVNCDLFPSVEIVFDEIKKLKLQIGREDAQSNLDADEKPVDRELYGGFWGEYPDFPREDWEYEVANEDTGLGYWEWVDNQIAFAKEADTVEKTLPESEKVKSELEP
jgi:hypothetical protein